MSDDADSVTKQRFRLDAALEGHWRDAEWLVERGFLVASGATASTPDAFRFGGRSSSTDATDPRSAAQALRTALGLRSEPILGLAEACGKAGLHVLVVPGLEAGASMTLTAGLGVAVIGGDDPPGRRRVTAAHELGHFILQDEYSTDLGVAAARDEREQAIETFAVEFLLPADALAKAWRDLTDRPERHRLIAVAGEFRVSWSVAVRAARDIGLLSEADARRLQAKVPHRGDFLEVIGSEPATDLQAWQTSPQWVQATLSAWRAGEITATRAVELLHDTIKDSDLPDRDESYPV